MEESTYELTAVETRQIVEAYNIDYPQSEGVIYLRPMPPLSEVFSWFKSRGTPIVKDTLMYHFASLIYKNAQERHNNCVAACVTFMFSPLFPKDIKRVIVAQVYRTHRDSIWNT